MRRSRSGRSGPSPRMAATQAAVKLGRSGRIVGPDYARSAARRKYRCYAWAMRLVRLLGALVGLCACLSCGSGGKLAEAGIYVAAAAAVQIAEANARRAGTACSQTCFGCCDSGGRCVDGETDAVCGRGGMTCQSCSLIGQMCGGGTCSAGTASGTSPRGNPGAQSPSPGGCDVSTCPACLVGSPTCAADDTCVCAIGL